MVAGRVAAGGVRGERVVADGTGGARCCGWCRWLAVGRWAGGRVREVGGVVVGRRPCPRAPMSKHKLTVRSCTAGQVTS